MRIKTKILIPMLALTILVAVGILVSNIVLFSNYVDDAMVNDVNSAAAVAANNIEVLKAEAKTASLYMAASNGIVNAVATNDRNELIRVARYLQSESAVEFCTIMDANGTVILRTHEPDNYGDSLASQANVQAAMSGRNLTAVERGSAVRLSVRSGSPIVDAAGNVIGVVSVGFRLDTDQFVDSLKRLLGCEATVFSEDESISTTALDDDGVRGIGLTASPEVSQIVLGGSAYVGHASTLGRDAVANYSPVFGPDGQAIGMVSVGYYVDETTRTIWAFVRSGLLITIILLAVSTAVILFIARHIVTPIHSMVTAASSLAAGDTNIDVQVDTHDETRTLADAFNEMIDDTRKQVKIIERIAKGDLTVSLETRSEKDIMNNAIISMLDMNNSVFSGIINSARQVSSGSKQMADSAQALAQGATDQAASIVELSNAISEIAGKTKLNSEMANKTTILADTIKSNAEKGSHQMDEMTKAVVEINDASQQISKVIKTIDDIAFQTNILALNAAVEAARAGEHGKGFAVVAEEVRNLATQSAEAAKDTAKLIENSMEKAAFGTKITEETVASLQEIVSGINESSLLIRDIATSSEEQSADIGQVNIGIDQVSQIIQQNSATAQESAAASEEMSGQASMLEDLVSRFKLRRD